MATQSETRNDKITAPRRMSETHVHALAMQKAQAKVRRGNVISELQLGEGNPVGGNHGNDVEWSYTYTVVQAPES
jgi:hypothetical protein